MFKYQRETCFERNACENDSVGNSFAHHLGAVNNSVGNKVAHHTVCLRVLSACHGDTYKHDRKQSDIEA